MKKLLFVAAVFVALFASCKKTDTTVERTVPEKLFGKWNLVTIVSNDYYAGAPHLYTRQGQANDYIEFKAGNKITLSFMGFVETQSYILQENTKIIVNGQTSEIKTLTDNALVLYDKTLGTNSGEFSEETQTFSR
jgi:hypothetical protein